jgi:hypothetical protein
MCDTQTLEDQRLLLTKEKAEAVADLAKYKTARPPDRRLIQATKSALVDIDSELASVNAQLRVQRLEAEQKKRANKEESRAHNADMVRDDRDIRDACSFASDALGAIISMSIEGQSPENAVSAAWEYSDAMMEQRNKRFAHEHD